MDLISLSRFLPWHDLLQDEFLLGLGGVRGAQLCDATAGCQPIPQVYFAPASSTELSQERDGHLLLLDPSPSASSDTLCVPAEVTLAMHRNDP